MKYRKIKKRWKNISKNKKMMILFTIILSVITVGYAIINQSLNIEGYASLDKGDGMIFTGIGIKENNGATIEKDASIKAKTLVNTQISFQSSGSITFNVSAQNQGTTDAKLIEIKGLEESNIKEPSCIKVSVQDHNVGDLVFPSQIKNFTITITSTCSTYSSKELDLHFVYEKQETINGVLPVPTLGSTTTNLLNTKRTYNYMDGTYLQGDPDSNYVWFDGFLWRIMGTNADGSVRMITEENVTAILWGLESDTDFYFANSPVYDWLNNEFYSKLEDKAFLVDQIWCSEPFYGEIPERTTCTDNLSKVSAKVGLLSIDELFLANGDVNSDLIVSSYLTNGQSFATLTGRYSDVWSVSYWSEATFDDDYTVYGVRPVINVHPDTVITGGSGTLSSPYTIQDKENVTGNLKDHSYVGEYVTYAGRNYRVVETSNEGTKLILDGYYDSNNNGIIEDEDKLPFIMEEGMEDTCILCMMINEESYINWISNNNESEKNKLITTTWTDSIDDSTSVTYSYEGRIGLISVGEVLASQSETILSKNRTERGAYRNAQEYWMVPSYLEGFGLLSAVMFSGGISALVLDPSYLSAIPIRPVIMISPDVQITSGNGSFESPYQI